MIRLALALGLAQAGFHAFVASLPVAMVLVGRPDDEIGAIMGSAAVFNIVAALASGGLIDRYGGRAVFTLGCASLGVGALLLAIELVRPDGPVAGLLVVRFLQGCGLACVLPSVATLVPGLVSKARMPMALGFVGVAANLSLAIVPPASLAVMDRTSLSVVGWVTAASVVLSMLILLPLPDSERAAREAGHAERSRGFRPTWRRSWATPLAISFLFVAHWGVVLGYLPQRAEAAGADIGLFFTGDALALLALRIPAAWLAGRIGVGPLVVAGTVVASASLALLLLPPTTPLLVLAGIGTGAGGAMALPTIMIELTHRSDASDRGSAFGLYTVSFGAGIAIGSVGIAPFYSALGFEVAMGAMIVACVAAGVVAILDGDMRHPPRAAPATTATEPATGTGAAPAG